MVCRKNIFKILRYFRPYWLFFISSFICSIIISILSIVVPTGFGKIVDLVVSNSELEKITFVVAILILAMILSSIFSFVGGYLYTKMNSKVLIDIRQDMFNNMCKLPMEYFAKENEGNIVSRFLNDANSIQNLVGGTVFSIVSDSLILISVLITLMIKNKILALISLISIIGYVFIVKFNKGIKKIALKIQEDLASITTVLQETISGIRTIKLFSGEKRQEELFYSKGINWLNNVVKVTLKTSFLKEFAGLYTSVFPIIILWYGAILVKENSISIGEVISFYSLLGQLYNPCKRLSQQGITLTAGMAVINRVVEFLELEGEVHEDENSISLCNVKGKLELRNVYFNYESNKPLLEGINLKVLAGQTVGLVGRSGMGKSTIVDLCTSILKPKKGAILIDDQDINKINYSNKNQIISVVSQDVFLFNNSIRENIRYGRYNATDDEVEEAAKIANADEFIKDLPNGYDTIVGNRGYLLSAGQRQRISIARAVLKDSKILILDEATSSLDSSSQHFIKEALNNVMKGRSSLIIAHRLFTIVNCDYIYVIDNGKIVESGTHEELIKNKNVYWYLYNQEISTLKDINT